MDELQTFKINLGKRIASLREKKGLTQQQLASLLNKDFQSISRLENGRVNASVYTIKKIADALEVSMAEFCDF